jgi:alpha,alpha-trehalase
VRWLLEQARDLERAESEAAALYPKLYAHHRWWHTARDPEESGLVCSYHPWETGRDNSPEWDQPFTAVPETETKFRRRDAGLVDSSERPRQNEYRRYIYLLELFRSFDYDRDALYAKSPFKVADIGINSILARADRDLLALSERFGSRAEQTHLRGWLENAVRAMPGLWNPALRCFNGFNLLTGQRLDLPVSAGFLPLFAGLANRDQAGRMAAELERWRGHARYLVPSLAPDHSLFEPRRYWRGPAWSIVSYMIALGLRDYGFAELSTQIHKDVQTLTECGGFHEYFSPLDGQGCGGGNFSWTAAIALWWAAE